MNAIMMLHRAMAGYLAAQGGGGGSKYIEFADQAVLDVLLANGIGDGIGITVADAEAVTEMEKTFNSNATIVSFDEMARFTNLQSLGKTLGWPSGYGTFRNCTSLVSVTIPPSVKTLGGFAFSGCTSLTHVGDLSNIELVGGNVFASCSSLAIVINMPNLQAGSSKLYFKGSGIVGVGNIGSVDLGGGWKAGCFQQCTSLKFAILPPSVTTISGYDFSGCTALTTMVIKSSTPPALGGALPSNLISVYVPDEAISDFASATNWNSITTKIKGISTISNDSLYNEIKDYL